MSIVASDLAAGFVVSYVANVIPIPLNPNLEQKIADCYNWARRQWKCQAVRDKYEGRELLFIEDLKEYIKGKKGKINSELNELLSRWVFKMSSDPVCATFINSLKEDELLTIIKTLPESYAGILSEIKLLLDSLSRIEASLEKHDDELKGIKNQGEEIKASIDSLGRRREEDSLKPFLSKDVCRYDSQFESTIYQESGLSVSDLFITPICTLSRFSNQGEHIVPMTDSVIEDCKSIVEDNGLLLIKGPYGCGKTILTKAMIGEFRKDGLYCVCFQANRINPSFFSDFSESIKECIDIHSKLYIFIDSCELLLSDTLFVLSVSQLLNDFKGSLHFIINYRSIQDNETDRVLNDFADLLSPAVLNLEYFNKTSIQLWLDRFNRTRIGSGASVITYEDIQKANKNLRESCKNPLVLYMVSSNDEAKEHLLDKNWYGVFDEFINKTISGKFESEKNSSPFFQKYNLSKKWYYDFLATIAREINRDSDSINVLSQAVEDDFYLDSNEVPYSIDAVKIEDCVPERIAKEFEGSNSMGTIPESLIQTLNCYFFEVSNVSCRFRDNNILFFFKAVNYSRALKAALEIYNQDVNNLKKSFEKLSSATAGMIFHPVEIEFVLNYIEKYKLTAAVSGMIYSMIENGIILNIEEKGRCEVDYNRIKIETLLCIICMKFLKGHYRYDKMRFFFKRLSQYHSFAKLVDNDLSSIIQRYFNKITIAGAEFRRINLKKYNFNGSVLNNTTFIQCKLEDPSIRNITCKNTTFDMCLISEIKDGNASVSGTINFNGCKLKNVTIRINKVAPGTILIFKDCVIDQVNIFTNSNQNGVKVLTSFNDCIIRQCKIKADTLLLSIPRVLLDSRIQVEADFCKYFLGNNDDSVTNLVEAKCKKLSEQDDEITSFD